MSIKAVIGEAFQVLRLGRHSIVGIAEDFTRWQGYTAGDRQLVAKEVGSSWNCLKERTLAAQGKLPMCEAVPCIIQAIPRIDPRPRVRQAGQYHGYHKDD